MDRPEQLVRSISEPIQLLAEKDADKGCRPVASYRRRLSVDNCSSVHKPLLNKPLGERTPAMVNLSRSTDILASVHGPEGSLQDLFRFDASLLVQEVRNLRGGIGVHVSPVKYETVYGLLQQFLIDPDFSEDRKRTLQNMKKGILPLSGLHLSPKWKFIGEVANGSDDWQSLLRSLLESLNKVRDKPDIAERLIRRKLHEWFDCRVTQRYTDPHLWAESDRVPPEHYFRQYSDAEVKYQRMAKMFQCLAMHIEKNDVREPAMYYRPGFDIPIVSSGLTADQFLTPIEVRITMNGKSIPVPKSSIQTLSECSFIQNHVYKQVSLFSPERWEGLSPKEQAEIVDEVLMADKSFLNDNDRFDFRVNQEVGDQLPLACVFSSRDFKEMCKDEFSGTKNSQQLKLMAGQKAMRVLRDVLGMDDRERVFVRDIMSQGPINDIYMRLIEKVLPKADIHLHLCTSIGLQQDAARCGGMELNCWDDNYLEANVELRFDELVIDSKKIPRNNSILNLSVLAVRETEGVRVIGVSVNLAMNMDLKDQDRKKLRKEIRLPVSKREKEKDFGKKLREITNERRERMIFDLLYRRDVAMQYLGCNLPVLVKRSDCELFLDNFEGALPFLGASDALPACIGTLSGTSQVNNTTPKIPGRLIHTQTHGWVVTNLTSDVTQGIESPDDVAGPLLDRHVPAMPMGRHNYSRLSLRGRYEKGYESKHKIGRDGQKKLRTSLGLPDVASLDQILLRLHEHVIQSQRKVYHDREHDVLETCKQAGLNNHDIKAIKKNYWKCYASPQLDGPLSTKSRRVSLNVDTFNIGNGMAGKRSLSQPAISDMKGNVTYQMFKPVKSSAVRCKVSINDDQLKQSSDKLETLYEGESTEGRRGRART